jgi:hypothetical protein
MHNEKYVYIIKIYKIYHLNLFFLFVKTDNKIFLSKIVILKIIKNGNKKIEKINDFLEKFKLFKS